MLKLITSLWLFTIVACSASALTPNQPYRCEVSRALVFDPTAGDVSIWGSSAPKGFSAIQKTCGELFSSELKPMACNFGEDVPYIDVEMSNGNRMWFENIATPKPNGTKSDQWRDTVGRGNLVVEGNRLTLLLNFGGAQVWSASAICYRLS